MAADWSYGSLSGPPEWNSLCAAGIEQSPIDIPMTPAKLVTTARMGGINFQYKRASPSFMNTGHGTMQVDYPSGSNFVLVGERKLELLQYHFHAPSEHSFDGNRTAMEAHLVHRDEKGLAVVGVMIEAEATASRNLCLQAALDFAPDEHGAKSPTPTECFPVPNNSPGERQLCFSLEISPASLLPKPDHEDGLHSYVHYEGSLTTPPCSEGVDWFLLTKPIKIPGEQVVEFMTYVGDKQTLAMNSRPPQNLGGRSIYSGPSKI